MLIIECSNCNQAHSVKCIFNTFDDLITDIRFCPACGEEKNVTCKEPIQWRKVILCRIESLRKGKCYRDGTDAHPNYVAQEIPRLENAIEQLKSDPAEETGPQTIQHPADEEIYVTPDVRDRLISGEWISPEWISVDDLLPETPYTVLTINADGGAHELRNCDGVDWHESRHEARFQNVKIIVTHWMPLPEWPGLNDWESAPDPSSMPQISQEWISVDDRLPEEDGMVLVTVAVQVGLVVTSLRYEGSGPFYDKKVTHWMPLPEPPEVKAEDKVEKTDAEFLDSLMKQKIAFRIELFSSHGTYTASYDEFWSNDERYFRQSQQCRTFAKAVRWLRDKTSLRLQN